MIYTTLYYNIPHDDKQKSTILIILNAQNPKKKHYVSSLTIRINIYVI